MFLLPRCIAFPRLKSSEMLPSQAWGEGGRTVSFYPAQTSPVHWLHSPPSDEDVHQ